MPNIYVFNENKKVFGDNLKLLMKENNITIDDLSYKINYDINTINKWRSGDRIPNLNTLKQLAEIFNISIHRIYLPRSFYPAKISNELLQLIDSKDVFNIDNNRLISELKDYSNYLLQKMLFSFLNIKEKNEFKSLFRYFEISKYGTEKLELDENTFEEFYDNSKKYVREQYGTSIPYKIDTDISLMLIEEYRKILNIKVVGGMK